MVIFNTKSEKNNFLSKVFFLNQILYTLKGKNHEIMYKHSFSIRISFTTNSMFGYASKLSISRFDCIHCLEEEHTVRSQANTTRPTQVDSLQF